MIAGRTATSTVFSCPTKLISEVQVFRVMTAAIKTYPLLLVAFDAVMCAPSGDQLPCTSIASSKKYLFCIPEPPEEGAAWRVFEWLRNFSLQAPIRGFPDLHSSIIGLSGKEL